MKFETLSNLPTEALIELKEDAISELHRLQNSDDIKSVEFWTMLHASIVAIVKLRNNG